MCIRDSNYYILYLHCNLQFGVDQTLMLHCKKVQTLLIVILQRCALKTFKVHYLSKNNSSSSCVIFIITKSYLCDAVSGDVYKRQVYNRQFCCFLLNNKAKFQQSSLTVTILFSHKNYEDNKVVLTFCAHNCLGLKNITLFFLFTNSQKGNRWVFTFCNHRDASPVSTPLLKCL